MMKKRSKLSSIIDYLTKPPIILPLAICLLSICFTEKAASLISALIVQPLLGTIDSPSYRLDIISIFVCIVMTIFLLKKGFDGIRISPLVGAYFLMITFVYLYFRKFQLSYFKFIHFKISFLNDFAVADEIFGLCAFWLIYLAYFKVISVERKSLKKTDGNGFQLDTPVILTAENDSLGRRSNAENLKDLLCNTNNEIDAFAVGIIGSWGSGKTSFLKTLEEYFKDEAEVIQMHFNPWITKSADSITAIFFSDLAAKLSKFDSTVNPKFKKYTDQLLQESSNMLLQMTSKFFTMADNNEDLEDQYDRLNKLISAINKKVIVYVDDLDRLDKMEIMEVLRIIRNTANFGHVIFLAAFDKPYINSQIKGLHGENSGKYLEKIFQLEYYLPVYNNNGIYVQELLRDLKKEIKDDRWEIAIQEMMNPTPKSLAKIEILPKLEKYIVSYRDAKRFKNIFLLNFSRVKNNIYLPDFIAICVLRLKFPEVHNLLYFSKNDFLASPGNPWDFGSLPGKVTLRVGQHNPEHIDRIILHNYLEQNFTQLDLSQPEIILVMSLLTGMFGTDEKMGNLIGERTLFRNHLSITNATCFLRYFDFSIAGQLDEVEFEDALKTNLKELEKKMLKWNAERSITTDAQLKFENYNIPPIISEFEKVITAMIFFSYLPASDTGNLLSYETRNFYEKLGGRKKHNKILRDVYAGDLQRYKFFFNSLFLLYPERLAWGFLHDFVDELIREYSDDFIVSHAEMKELIAKSFFQLTDTTDSIDRIMRFYNRAAQMFKDKDPSTEYLKPIGKGLDMTLRIREKIKEDVAGFLNWNIYFTHPPANYQLSNWDVIIFGDRAIFENFLAEFKDYPEVKEYLVFSEKYKAANRDVPFEFQFLNPR